LGELASSTLLGVGKGVMALGGIFDNPTAFTAYAGAAMMQGAIAGYMTYAIGKAAQVYLAEGCSWGQQGASRVICSIFAQLDPHSISYRLQQELITSFSLLTL
jgi:hypothetical protein